MKLRQLHAVASRAILALIVLAAGCTTRRLGREDLGALRGDEHIVVVTQSGIRHELTSFQFLSTGLVGRGERGQIEMPLDSIALVEVREVSTAGVALAVLAAGTAVGVLIALGESPEKPPDTSCPFVYSLDGERYHFDSETFAGAAMPGMDRTDYDNLERLLPVGGRYRLRLTNERPE